MVEIVVLGILAVLSAPLIIYVVSVSRKEQWTYNKLTHSWTRRK